MKTKVTRRYRLYNPRHNCVLSLQRNEAAHGKTVVLGVGFAGHLPAFAIEVPRTAFLLACLSMFMWWRRAPQKDVDEDRADLLKAASELDN